MGVNISGTYVEKKKVELRHGPSGAQLTTAAPVDNEGDGSSFSPTDLVATGLGACMLTLIANVAERSGISVTGATVSVEKNMMSDPRRIASLPAVVHLPRAIPATEREKLERAALTCPVRKSLLAEIDTPVEFVYDI